MLDTPNNACQIRGDGEGSGGRLRLAAGLAGEAQLALFLLPPVLSPENEWPSFPPALWGHKGKEA